MSNKSSTKRSVETAKAISVQRPPFVVILLAMIVLFAPFYVNSDKRKAVNNQYAALSVLPIPEKDIDLSFIEIIPDGKQNGRLKQPTIDQLHHIGQSGKYSLMIRLNGDGKDSGGVSLSQQDSILHLYGMRLIFLDVHLSTTPENIHKILLDFDGVLVHCLHGFDRTGGVVGYHLRQMGLTISEVIAHNRWEGYLEKKGQAYYKYFKLIL